MGSFPYVAIPEHGMNWWASKAAPKARRTSFARLNLGTLLGDYRQTHANVRPQITLTPPPKPLPAARCIMCRELRVLYIQAAESLINLRNTAAANRDRLVAYGEMGRRRMAAAYELGELTQMKESLIPAPNMSTAAVASSVGFNTAASAVGIAPVAARSLVVDPPAHHGQTVAPAPSAQFSGVPVPVVANSTIGPVPTVASANAVSLSPDQVGLNSRSQWISGTTLSPEEIIKRLGAASRRGRTWNMRSGQWHSGYFWALPDGKIDESGCSTAQNSVGPHNPSNFSQTSKAAEQEPPPTTYGFPDKFSSKHFRHTPPGTAQNAAASTQFVTGAVDLLNMFGPRAAGSSATVKPLEPPEMTARPSIAVPVLQPSLVQPTSAPGETHAVHAAIPALPPLAQNMFQMFGPPSAAQQGIQTAVTGIYDATVPMAEHAVLGNSQPYVDPVPNSLLATAQWHPGQASSRDWAVPTSDATPTAPPERPKFDMFGTFKAPSAMVSGDFTFNEQGRHGDRTMAAAPAPRFLKMFGSSAAPRATVSAPVAEDDRVQADGRCSAHASFCHHVWVFRIAARHSVRGRRRR